MFNSVTAHIKLIQRNNILREIIRQADSRSVHLETEAAEKVVPTFPTI